MGRITTTTYSCEICKKEFKQKSHYNSHKSNKRSCLPNLEPNKIIEVINDINNNNMPSKRTTKKVENSIDDALMETINKTINKDALKEYIHDIHNMLRNNGAGYGMNALKVFIVFYALWVLEKKNKLEEYKLENCSFSMLKDLADKNKEESIVTEVQNRLVEALHSNNKLRPFFYTEIPGDMIGNTMKELILKIHNLPNVENVEGQLCGKIYEYFIGRDQTAISELGAYFTDRHITDYIFNLLDIELNEDESIPSMIDYFGGSGGFTVGYANYMNNKYPEIDWKEEINKIHHYDMNEDVIKYAALELLSITDQVPDNKHIRVTNTFKHKFNKQYDLCITNPPYGGDNIKPSRDYMVRQKVVNYIKSLDNPTEQQKIQRKVFEDFIKKEKKERDSQKVTLEGSSPFIKKYAKEHKLSGNDKEAVSLILLMATTAINGTACAVLKQGVFFDKKYSGLRKHLIENFNVTHVIKVDSNQFENTGTTTSIIKFHNTPDNTTKKVVFKEFIVERFTEDKLEITDKGYVRMIECKGNIKGNYDRLKSEATIEELRAETGKKKIQLYSLDGSKYGIKPLKCKEGYELKKIGELCDFAIKSKRQASFGQSKGSFKFYTSSSSIKYCNINDYKKLSIVIGTGGLSSIHLAENFSCSTDNFILQGDNLKYLYFIIRTLFGKLINSMSGSVLKHLSKEYLENFEIPIPTSKQKIKEWSDKISKPYNEYVEKTELVKKLEQDVQEKIQKMIEEEECDEYKLGDICTIKSSPGGKSYTNYIVPQSEYKLIRGRNLSDKVAITYITESGYNQFLGYQIHTGDILIPEIYSSTTFNSMIVPKEWDNSIFKSCFRIYQLQVSNNYLIRYINSSLFTKQLSLSTVGSTVQHASVEILRDLIIKIPKNKNKLDSLNKYYSDIEKNKQEAQEAEKLYKDLILQLKSEALDDDE